jgi:circadian clock protein KaiC
VNRLSTGIAELDLVLGGGLKTGSVVILGGPPGTGKTILAQQICFANATAQRKAIYYTTISEPHSKLVEHLEQFDFFDAEALGPKIEYLHLGDLLRDDAGGGLQSVVTEVVRQATEVESVLVVIDSVKMLRDFVSERQLRTALYDLNSRLGQTGAVLLLLGEYTPEEMNSGVEFSLADGIIQLSFQPREPVDRRWLRITKMRGGNHRAGKHAFQITTHGVEVFPRIEALDPAELSPYSGRIPSGIPGLDDLLGGGIPAGDATLLAGPSGAGKTIGCLRFVAQGLTTGERCLYITFQDSAEQLVGMATGFGWDLHAARSADEFVISHVPMGSLDLDVLASVIRRQLADGAVGRVVIDSLAEMVLAAREAERFPAYLRSLIGLIRASGASLLVTSETTLQGAVKEPLDGLMFLFHNIVQLRYIEQESGIGRAVNVLKMRNSEHDTDVYHCDITAHGLTVGDKLERVTGILGWTALTDTAVATRNLVTTSAPH